MVSCPPNIVPKTRIYTVDNKKLEPAKFLIIFLIVTLNNILIFDQHHDITITDLQRSWSSFKIKIMIFEDHDLWRSWSYVQKKIMIVIWSWSPTLIVFLRHMQKWLYHIDLWKSDKNRIITQNYSGPIFFTVVILLDLI